VCRLAEMTMRGDGGVVTAGDVDLPCNGLPASVIRTASLRGLLMADRKRSINMSSG